MQQVLIEEDFQVQFRYETKKEYENALAELLRKSKSKKNALKFEAEYEELLEEYLMFCSSLE